MAESMTSRFLAAVGALNGALMVTPDSSKRIMHLAYAECTEVCYFSELCPGV